MKNLLLLFFLINYFHSIGQVEIYAYVNDGQSVSVMRDSQNTTFVIIDNNENDTICFMEDRNYVIKNLFKNDTLCTFITQSYSEPFNRTYFFLYKKTNGYWRFLDSVYYDESPVGFQQFSYQYNQIDILTFEVIENIIRPAPKLTKYTYKYDGNGNLVVTETQL